MPIGGVPAKPRHEIDQKSGLNTEDDAIAQTLPKSGPKRFSRLTVVLALLMIFGPAIWGAQRMGMFRRSTASEAPVLANEKSVPVVEQDPVDDLIDKVRQQCKEPRPDINAIVHNLDQIQQLAPGHPALNELLPVISVATGLQHIRDGDLAAAHQELEKAAQSGAERSQLLAARETLLEAYLSLVESNIDDERYEEALTNCYLIRDIEGTTERVAPFQARVGISVAERAVTEQDIQNAITALEPLHGLAHQEQAADVLMDLYFRHSKLAYSVGNLGTAVDRFAQSVLDDERDVERLEFGGILADAALIAFEGSRSQENRDRALQITECLDKNGVDAEGFLLIKLRLVKALLSAPKLTKRDSDVDFALRTVNQASLSRPPIEPPPAVIRLVSKSLRNRGLRRVSDGNIIGGVDDLRLAKDMAPSLKDSFEVAVKRLPRPVRHLLPKDVFDPSNLDTDEQLWSRVPSTAEAFSVVRDMEEFSDEVCEVSNSLNIPAPNLLNSACQLSGIDDGLRRIGSLGWVKLPVAGNEGAEGTGSIFLLPTSDFLNMIKPLQATEKKNPAAPNAKLKPVLMNGASGFAASSESYTAFAFASDKATLSKAIEFDQSLRGEMDSFGEFGEDLDAYFVVTPRGVRRGLQQYQIPFYTPESEKLITLFREAVHESVSVAGQEPQRLSQWLRQAALGLAIQPDQGIAVRSRLRGDPDFDLSEILSVNRGGREKALDLLPNEPFLFALGGPVSPKQCEWLADFAGRIFPDQQRPQIRITDLQIAVLAPEPPPAIANQPPPINPEAIHSRLQRNLIVVVRLDDSQSALDDLEARFNAAAAPAAPAVERLVLNGVDVLRIPNVEKLHDQFPDEPMLLMVAAPNKDTLVFTPGDEAQLILAMAPSLGAASMSTAEIVQTAVRMLPESTSSLVVLDFRTILREALLANLGQRGQFGHQLAFMGLQTEEPQPAALGISWGATELDVHLSLPAEIFPLIGRVLVFGYPYVREWLSND